MLLRAVHLLLTKRGLKRFVIMPLAANVLIYVLVVGLLIVVLWRWHPAVGDWDFWGPVGLWLAGASNWVLGPLKWIVALPAMFFLCYFTFTFVGFVIAAPLNDMLSGRVERAICVRKPESSVPLPLKGKLVVMSMLDALGILVRQLFWTVLVLPLLLVPVIGVVVLFLVTAYFTGLGFFDVAMARNHLCNLHKKPVMAAHRFQMLGLGMAMEILFLIPFAGLLMLPVGVTAGTLLYCRIDWTQWLAANKLDRPPGFCPPRCLSQST